LERQNWSRREVDVSGITGTPLDAQICVVLQDVSLMKKGRGDGEIADEKKKCEFLALTAQSESDCLKKLGKELSLVIVKT